MKELKNRAYEPRKKPRLSNYYKRNKHGYNSLIKAFNDEITEARYIYNF